MGTQATSLKLPVGLKARVEAAAKKAGTSAHAFMTGAIERETTRTERYAAFLAEAKQADREFERTGTYYDAADVFNYLVARVDGKSVRRPKPRTWRR